MEYLEILLQDVSKQHIDLIVRQELKITNDSVISSHFFDKIQKIDMEYGAINSLVGYFSSPNTGNVFLEEVELGEKLPNTMIVMSFDEDYGDITLNFSEDEISNCDTDTLSAKIKRIVDKLIEIKKKYDIKNIRLGYESVIDDENVVLKISSERAEIVNKFEGKFANAVELAYI